LERPHITIRHMRDGDKSVLIAIGRDTKPRNSLPVRSLWIETLASLSTPFTPAASSWRMPPLRSRAFHSAGRSMSTSKVILWAPRWPYRYVRRLVDSPARHNRRSSIRRRDERPMRAVRSGRVRKLPKRNGIPSDESTMVMERTWSCGSLPVHQPHSFLQPLAQVWRPHWVAIASKSLRLEQDKDCSTKQSTSAYCTKGRTRLDMAKEWLWRAIVRLASELVCPIG